VPFTSNYSASVENPSAQPAHLASSLLPAPPRETVSTSISGWLKVTPNSAFSKKLENHKAAIALHFIH